MCDVSIVNASFSVSKPYIPIGPLIVLKELRKNGFEVEFKDYQLTKYNNIDYQFVSENLKALESDIICIGVFANSLPIVLKAVNLFKKTKPKSKIILAGAGVSDVPDRIFEISDIDIIIRGEGEITTPELIKCLKKGKKLDQVRGITYRDGDNIIHNLDRGNLDYIDYYPDYSQINFADYNNEVTIITSRGCPYECSFCAKPIWRSGIGYRSLDNIFEEIESIKDKIRRIYFCDDAFIVNRARVFEFCDRFKKLKVDIKWECTGRIGLMDEELLSKLNDSGCDTIYLGIESGTNKILKRLNKKITIEDARKEIELAKKHIKNIYTSYIWGFPFETLDDFNDTIFNYMTDSVDSITRPVLNLATPFISTRIYEEYKDKLFFLDDNKYSGSVLPMNVEDANYSEMREFIVKNKDIFPSFFFINHDSFVAKKNLIDKLLEKKDTEEVNYA